MTDYKATLDEMRQMWNAYELHGLDMEGNPYRCEESVRPTAAIVMVLNGHAALHSCLTELEEYHQNDAALRAENERLRGLIRGFRSIGEPLFAGYLKSVQVLTAQVLHLIRGARTVLDQAAAFK